MDPCTLYLQRFPSTHDIEKMHHLIDVSKFVELEKYVVKFNEKLKFGECQYGKQFIFSLPLNTWEPTRSGMIDYCKQHQYMVVGLDKQLTIDEAFELINNHNSDSANKRTLRTIYETEPTLWHDFYEATDCKKYWIDKGYTDIKYNVLINDGLQFKIK